MLTPGQEIQSCREFTFSIALYGKLNLVHEEMIGMQCHGWHVV